MNNPLHYLSTVTLAAVMLGNGASSSFSQELSIPNVLSDNMVIQRGIRAPVWGTATPGSKVTVLFHDSKASATADAAGKWKVALGPFTAGGPFEMTISTTGKKITFKNVLIGDVWVCSGQSNMQMGVGGVRNAQEEINTANYPNIRLFTVPNIVATTPQSNCDGNWSACTPQTVAGFSAAGFFFGRELHNKYKVPIGLINTSWGGTPVESWIRKEVMTADPTTAYLVEKYAQPPSANAEQLTAEYNKKLQEFNLSSRYADEGNKGETMGFAKSDFADNDWKTMAQPATWGSSASGPDVDGSVWFRKKITIPATWEGKDLKLSLGAIDDTDTTYFNGEKVGATDHDTPNYWAAPRVYTVPGTVVKAGEATIAVRVFNEMGQAGMTGPADALKIAPAESSDSISLTGDWKYQVESIREHKDAPKPPVAPAGIWDSWTPGGLYNAMIHPLIPFGIKGAIWYQGESNAGRSYEYRNLFAKMITNWRQDWGEGNFPFFWVQLANFMQRQPQPLDSGWAELREAQSMAMSLPKTAQAVIIDIGDAEDIHPKNKQDVGKRLAYNAEAIAYGDKVEYLGPVYKSMTVKGNEITLSFTHIGSGLSTGSSFTLAGFAISAADKKFHWATARIEGDKVVVSSPDVTSPTAVRYAWGDNPACNLSNKEGIPASPFRTDNWPGITAASKR